LPPLVKVQPSGIRAGAHGPQGQIPTPQSIAEKAAVISGIGKENAAYDKATQCMEKFFKRRIIMYNIVNFFRCECGAITLNMEDGRDYSCKEENLERFFPDLNLTGIEELQKSWACDHCVNGYGLDLCACGSGEPYETCENGFDCCNTPMQSLEDGYTCVRGDNAWGPVRDSAVGEHEMDAPRYKVGTLVLQKRTNIIQKIIFCDFRRVPACYHLSHGGDAWFSDADLEPIDVAEKFLYHIGDKVRVDVGLVAENGVPEPGGALERFLADGDEAQVFFVEAYIWGRESCPFAPYVLSGPLGETSFAEEELCPIEDEVAGKESDATKEFIQEALHMEERIKEFTKGIVKKIAEETRTTSVPGVKRLSSSPDCFEVSFKTIMSSPTFNLSAGYYSSEAQAKAVERALTPAAESGSISRVLEKIQKMVEDGSVTFSSGGNQRETFQLNKTTISILKKSVLQNISKNG